MHTEALRPIGTDPTLTGLSPAPYAEQPIHPDHVGEYVRRIPSLLELAAGDPSSRPTPVKYAAHMRVPLSTETAGSGATIATVSEHDSITGLCGFLSDAASAPDLDDYYRRDAQAILEETTFIGHPEYQEAVAGIPHKWRRALAENPQLQICVLASINKDTVKSDAYLLDNILQQFPDEELAALKGRLLTDLDHITADPEHTQVILIDDLMSTGSQLAQAANAIAREHPQLASSLRIQLLATSRDRLDNGLTTYMSGILPMTNEQPFLQVPIDAYFLGGNRITSALCATDNGFNNDIAAISHALGVDMPPGTNIVRPYRDPERPIELTQQERLRSINEISQQELTPEHVWAITGPTILADYRSRVMPAVVDRYLTQAGFDSVDQLSDDKRAELLGRLEADALKEQAFVATVTAGVLETVRNMPEAKEYHVLLGIDETVWPRDHVIRPAIVPLLATLQGIDDRIKFGILTAREQIYLEQELREPDELAPVAPYLDPALIMSTAAMQEFWADASERPELQPTSRYINESTEPKVDLMIRDKLLVITRWLDAHPDVAVTFVDDKLTAHTVHSDRRFRPIPIQDGTFQLLV